MPTEVSFPAERPFDFPSHCPACLAPAEGFHTVRLRVTTQAVVERNGRKTVAGHRTDERDFEVPYCERHLRDSLGLPKRLRAFKRTRLLGALVAAALAGGITAQALYYYTMLMEKQPAVFAAVVAAAAIIGPLVALPLVSMFSAKLNRIMLPHTLLEQSPAGATLAVHVGVAADMHTGSEEITLLMARKRYAEYFRKINGV